MIIGVYWLIFRALFLISNSLIFYVVICTTLVDFNLGTTTMKLGASTTMMSFTFTNVHSKVYNILKF